MKLARLFDKASMFLLLATIFLLNSCAEPDNSNSASNQSNSNSNKEMTKASEAKDDVDELLNRVRLPELPEEVVWQEENLPNSENKRMIAVLKYDHESVVKLLAVIDKYKQQGQVEVEAETWFPAELTAQAQLSGTESLKGSPFGASEFFNIPYGFGRIVQIENTNYFVLEVTTQ